MIFGAALVFLFLFLFSLKYVNSERCLNLARYLLDALSSL